MNDTWRAPHESPEAFKERMANGGLRQSGSFRYLVIFPQGQRHELMNRRWLDFSNELNKLVARYGQPPDLMYLVEGPR